MKNNEKMKAAVKDGNFRNAKQKVQILLKSCDPCECGIPGCECSGDCC